MGLKAIARMIQTMLYAKRFFPYYVYNILGGIEEDGKLARPSGNVNSFAGTGAVYSYDPVGSYEREACRAAGAAQSLLQPFLDNQVCTLGLSHYYDLTDRSTSEIKPLPLVPKSQSQEIYPLRPSSPSLPMRSHPQQNERSE